MDTKYNMYSCYCLPPRCFGGNPRSRSPGLDDGGTTNVVHPLGGIVLEHILAGEIWWWSGVTSSVLATTILGGVASWILDDERVLVDVRRAVAPFHVVVASMAGMARVFTSFFILEIGWRKMAGATSRAYAQGAISTIGRGADDGRGRGIRPRCFAYRLL